jgi:UDP-2-acetamido-2-deoxy-ribo-hexuluronate aminotransferase
MSLSPVPLFDAAAERAALGPEIDAAVAAVVTSGCFILGPTVAEAEAALSAHVSRPAAPPVRCVGVASGTDALQLALLALGVGPGDEVVTTPFTWISSAEVVPLVGGRIVFADVCKRTYCLDVESVGKVITEKTRAVIAVSLFGYVPDYSRLRAVVDAAAARFGTEIVLIEDGAQSFGGRGADGWRSCGSPCVDVATTSFFPSKPLGCYGDGGAVFTRDERVEARVRSLRVHGKDAGSGLHTLVGLNGRLDSIQAAVVVAKMAVFDDLVRGRVAVGERYRRGFAADGRVVLPAEDDGEALHVYGVYTVRVRERDKVARRLKEAGIGCAVYYRVCVHQQPVFAERALEKVVLPVAEQLSESVLSLPVHAYLAGDDQDRVVSAFLGALDELGVVKPPP